MKATPAGPLVAGVNVPAVLSVPTTPLVTVTTGWSSVIWTMASAVSMVPTAFFVWLRAWLVSSRPSANGSVETVTVNRMSATLAAGW